MDIQKRKSYIMLHAVILVYSLSGIFSKTAAGYEFFSLKWLLLYGCAIAMLGVYAIVWQQVLRRVDLNVAFVNKSVGMIWTMLWGVLVFSEKLSAFDLLGGALVIMGVILIVTEKTQDE